MVKDTSFDALSKELQKKTKDIIFRKKKISLYKVLRIAANDISFTSDESEALLNQLKDTITLPIPNQIIAVEKLKKRLST